MLMSLFMLGIPIGTGMGVGIPPPITAAILPTT
jgi:hypothetical protein